MRVCEVNSLGVGVDYDFCREECRVSCGLGSARRCGECGQCGGGCMLQAGRCVVNCNITQVDTDHCLFSELDIWQDLGRVEGRADQPDRPCLFPFTWQGETVTHCTDIDGDPLFCATELDNKGEMVNFGHCAPHCS